ncbi:MAG: hypothetical protein R6X15_01540, partial [Pseudomonadota bacterium]
RMHPGTGIKKDFMGYFLGMHGVDLMVWCWNLYEIKKSPCMHSIMLISPYKYLIRQGDSWGFLRVRVNNYPG